MYIFLVIISQQTHFGDQMYIFPNAINDKNDISKDHCMWNVFNIDNDDDKNSTVDIIFIHLLF